MQARDASRAEPAEGMKRELLDGAATHIARVAARLFATRGYDATSVREIVEAAGVTKPTLYYHFGSKEGLAQALLNRPLERTIAALRRVLDSDRDAISALAAMIELQFAFFREDPDRARFVYALFFGPLGSGLATEMSRYTEQFDRLMEEAVDRLVREQVIEANRAGAFLSAIRGLMVVYSVDFLYHGRELSDGLASRLVGDLLRGYDAGNPKRS